MATESAPQKQNKSRYVRTNIIPYFEIFARFLPV